jgi:hypothetical protein
LADFVGAERLAALAACTLRGETWYPVPYVLQAKPLLIGYYRLLYGISQKQFSKRPFGQFAPMEGSNRLSPANDRLLPALCRSLIITGGELFSGVQPVSASAIHELQLLTIGPQLRGSENNLIGEDATRTVFGLIEDLVRPHLESSTSQALVVRNAAQRVVRIAFASAPDIAIIKALPTQSVTSVSIEIKGGTDVSNVHHPIHHDCFLSPVRHLVPAPVDSARSASLSPPLFAAHSRTAPGEHPIPPAGLPLPLRASRGAPALWLETGAAIVDGRCASDVEATCLWWTSLPAG